MAKQAGLGMAFYVDGYDIGGDINSISDISSSQTLLDMTDITQLAHARLGGLGDGSLSLVSYFNPAANQAFPVLKTRPSADRILTVAVGTTLGADSACIVAKQTDFHPTRGADGSYLIKVDATANGYGTEWGNLVTAGKRTDTAATAGTPVDFGAARSFGFQAYLQVFSFTGTDVTIKLQDCATVGGVYADIASGAFTQVTSGTPQAQRIAVGGTATVRQFVKVTTVTTGGFSNCVFSVVLVQNRAAVAF